MIKSSESSNIYSILNLNIFRGYHTQYLSKDGAYAKYRWEARKDNLIKFVKHFNPDIIVFQECNKLEYADSVDKMMISLSQYRYEIFYSGSILQSRGQLIGFKKDKFAILKRGVRWLSPTPEKESDQWATKDPWGRIVCFMKLAPIDNNMIIGSKSFWIWNVHFNVENVSIVNSIGILPKIIDSTVNGVPFAETDQDKKNIKISSGQRIIVVGDFNSSSKRMIDSFASAGLTVDSIPLHTLDDVMIPYTYVGKKRDNKLKDSDCELLDYFFSMNVKTKTVICPLLSHEISGDYSISDHLPLLGLYAIN